MREQRKKIIEDINDYLNDQYNEPALRPIVDDNDVDDVIPELPVTNAAIVLFIPTSLGLALRPG